MLLEAWWSHSWPGSVSELRPPVPGASPWVSASSSQDLTLASPFLPTQIQASKKLQNGRPGPEISGPSTLGRSGQGEGEGPGRGKGTQSACGCWQSLKGPVPTTRMKEPQDNGSLPQPSSWPLKTALLGWQESASEVAKASGVWGAGGQRHQVWLKTPAPLLPGGLSCPSPHPTPRGRLDRSGSGRESRAQSSRPGGHHSDVVTQLEKLQRQAGERQAMQRSSALARGGQYPP